MFDAKHIAVLARFKPGELYDMRKIDDLRKALVATGLFSTVSVKPVRDRRAGAGRHRRWSTLQVRQVAGPPRTLAATAGYSTGEGFKVEGSWTHRNLFPPEGALIGTATLGSQEQGASATFRRSNAGQRDRTFSLGLALDHSNYDAFEAFTGTLSVRWAYDSTPIWQKKLTYAYGVELVGTNESVYDFDKGERVRGTYCIAALPGQAGFDTIGRSAQSRPRGYRLKLSLSPETSVQGRCSPYARTMVGGERLLSGERQHLVLAGRVRAGSILGISARRSGAVAALLWRRRRIGARLRLSAARAARSQWRSGRRASASTNLRSRRAIASAITASCRSSTAGNAYESSVPQLGGLRYGVGIGGRLYTNFGPLRVDVATPLNRARATGRSRSTSRSGRRSDGREPRARRAETGGASSSSSGRCGSAS